MLKSTIVALLVASSQAVISNSPNLNTKEYYVSGGSSNELISPEPKNLIATEDPKASMLGAFGAQTTPNDNDVTMFTAFKP